MKQSSDLQSSSSEKVARKIKTVSIIIMTIACFSTLLISEANIYSFDSVINLFEANFTQLVDDQEIYLETVADYQTLEVGETLVITNEIPEIHSDKILLFFTKDTESKVYVNGELIYSFEMQEEFEFLKTPGDTWNSVDINQEMSGQTITIELTSNFANKYETTLAGINLVDDGDPFILVLQADGFRMLMAIVLFLMSIWIYINAIIWKRPAMSSYFLHLGNIYFVTSLWLASLTGIFNLLFSRPAASYLVSMTMAIFLPAVICEFFKVTYKKKCRSLKILEYIVWTSFIGQILLQLVFGISLLDLLPITLFTYLVTSAGAFLLVLGHVLNKNRVPNFALSSTGIILIGGIAEIFVLILVPQRTDLIGVASVTGMLIYLMVNNFYIMFFESRIDIEKIELEENYSKLQNTTLMHQIKAHFFFNTLNTISSLCKYDAAEADRAILVFAQYMRSYMKLINQQENIDFKEELSIVEASLEIEHMRFPDNFTYEINLESSEFKIPPLSIQPIVENSMIHGLRKANKAGKITVETKNHTNYIEVIISDNGVGFNVESLEESNNIGLKNLEKRLKLMINGSIKIESTINVGTKTTLIIPK